MTLTEIAAELDLLITRLREARNILATLEPENASQPSRKSARKNPALPSSDLDPETTPERAPDTPIAASPFTATGKLSTTRARAPRKPRAPRISPPSKEITPSPLHGAVPQGPVVVSAAEVVRRRTTAEPETLPLPTLDIGHSLDDLVRELTHRADPSSLSPRV